MKQTIVIWDDCQANIRFFVVDRDLSHLDRKYLNNADNPKKLENEIAKLVYNKAGEEIVNMTTTFPVEVLQAGARVIVMGFLP